MQALLVRDPKQRLGGSKLDAIEVMNHAFFSNIKWEKLMSKEIEPCYDVSRAKIDEQI